MKRKIFSLYLLPIVHELFPSSATLFTKDYKKTLPLLHKLISSSALPTNGIYRNVQYQLTNNTGCTNRLTSFAKRRYSRKWNTECKKKNVQCLTGIERQGRLFPPVSIIRDLLNIAQYKYPVVESVTNYCQRLHSSASLFVDSIVQLRS